MHGTAGITAHRQNLRAITVGYRAALSATAALCLASTVFNHIQTGSHDAQIDIVSSAGRQRMQSEKLLSNIQLALNSQNDHSTRQVATQTLLRTLTDWKADQNQLANYVSQQGTRDLKTLLEQAAPHRQTLERLARSVVTSEGTANISLSEAIDAQRRFINKQENVLRELEELNSRYIGRLQTMQIASGILVLVCLALQGLFLFRPMVKKARRSLQAMEKQAENLHEMQDELLSQNESLNQSRTALGQAVTRAEDLAKLSRHVALRFEELFSGLPIATFTFGADGTIFEWNREAESLTGIAAAAAQGKSILEILKFSDNPAEHKRMIDGVFQGDHFYNIERQIERSNKFTHHVLLNAFPLRDPDGNITGAVCSLTDVSERHSAEQRMRKSEKRFRNMIEDLPAGAVLIEGDSFYMNRYLRSLTGFENLDLAKHEDWFKELLGDEALAFRDQILSGTAKEPTKIIEITCKDRRRRFVEVSAHCTELAEIWLVVDVTEHIAAQERLRILIEQRKEDEEALNLANEELNLAQTIAHVGSWQSSVDFSDLYWSPEMYRAMGFDPSSDPPTFAEFLTLIHPDDVEEFHRLAVDAAIEGREWQIEHRIILESGLERIVVSTIQPWLDRGRVIGTLLDVTQARQEARRVAESETLFRTSMNAIQAGVVFMNAAGQIQTVNPKAAELLELDADQLLGLKPIPLERYFVDEYGRELAVEEYPLCIAYRQRKVVDAAVYCTRRSDGKMIWLNVNAAPLMIDGQEEPVGAVASFTDVTELQEKQELLLTEMERTNEQALALEMQKFELEEMNEKLQALASLDGLTGLKNHRSFQEFFEHQYAIARRTNTPLSLVLLDVDRFKTFNDEFGHQAGDEVLKGVGKALLDAARESDYVARYGGEEFVVVLPGTDAAGAILAAERFRKVIEKQTWPYRQVTASFGAATLNQDITSREELVALADSALYRSKHDGRNRSTHANDLPAAA